MNMKATQALVLVFAALAAAPLAAAGRVKGMKVSSHTPATRELKKEKDKTVKTKKVAGPGARSCSSKASKKEVTFECRSGAVKAATKAADTKLKGDDKLKGADLEDAEVQAQEPGVGTRALGVEITPSEEIRDKIRYKVKTAKEGMQVKIEYEHEDKTSETDTEFELLFDRVIEYTKGKDSSSEAYDWEADDIIQTIDLTGGWQDISDISTDETEVVSYFTATSALAPASEGRSAGSIEFNYTISTEDQSEQITANSMKIDVRILGFPWSRDDSYIALMSTVESKKNVKLGHDEKATVGNAREAKDVLISFTEKMADDMGISAFGQYTWAFEALATPDAPTTKGKKSTKSATIDVIATSPADEETDNLQHIAYSFVGEGAHLASEIYWDPQAGIGYEEPIPGGDSSETETLANEATSASCPEMSSIGLMGSLVATMLYLVA